MRAELGRIGAAGMTAVDLGCGLFGGQGALPGLRAIHRSRYCAAADRAQPRRRSQLHRVLPARQYRREALPEGDICFVRQVLQHLSNDQIAGVLPKLGKFRWCFITEHLLPRPPWSGPMRTSRTGEISGSAGIGSLPRGAPIRASLAPATACCWRCLPAAAIGGGTWRHPHLSFRGVQRVMNAQAIEHRAAKVSMVNGLSTILAVGFQLVSVPVCLRYWARRATELGWHCFGIHAAAPLDGDSVHSSQQAELLVPPEYPGFARASRVGRVWNRRHRLSGTALAAGTLVFEPCRP